VEDNHLQPLSHGPMPDRAWLLFISRSVEDALGTVNIVSTSSLQHIYAQLSVISDDDESS
jgi:hypothetical protein